MYRVFLIPTDESPRKEVWIDATFVHETDGAFWEFVDRDDHVVRRLEKSIVKRIEVTADRRRPRAVQDAVVPDALWGVTPSTGGRS